MGYPELTNWMFNLERFGIKLGLENISEFMARIGDPQKDFKSVHVTGTNGKGSVCVMASEILRKSGLKVGLYTSPHLVDFRERIVVDGCEIPERDVVRIASSLRNEMESMASESAEKQLTFFEFTTGLAFKYFSEQKVDVVVAEVGMGGRLDATNVLIPEVAAITRIGLEHTKYLGSTIAEIAREKAGIIKEAASVVTCETSPEALTVISNACARKNARLKRLGPDFKVSSVKQSLGGTVFDYSGTMQLSNLRTRLLGRHQAENAAASIAIVEELVRKGYEVNDEDIRQGVRSTRWPGRLDIVSKKPLVILDGSHNPDGVRTTIGVLRDLKITPLTFVIGCMDDKDAAGVIGNLAPSAAQFICTQAKSKRALPANRLARIAETVTDKPIEVVERSDDAFDLGLRTVKGKGLCVTGSLYLVGEAIPWWKSRN